MLFGILLHLRFDRFHLFFLIFNWSSQWIWRHRLDFESCYTDKYGPIISINQLHIFLQISTGKHFCVHPCCL